MTQGEKILLLKDICVRIPYGLKASVRGSIEESITFDILSVATNFKVFVENRFMCISHYEDIEVVRPYLRPIMSMTEKEYNDYISTWRLVEHGDIEDTYEPRIESYDWLNANHFDYRGLIEKGLALEAPSNMYNN